ncbi:WG repeat-containing protein [Brevibacillus sp. SYP-B805]|uniref:WG repeat-containing protein n=1 Tax=Brevibacillus sp. SYP-B805 TaxID=1578199 RepID=UPI0013E9C5E7|nr:WG repeat-containing protein [Brevibacillus sp. SYP-B805]NGQ94219.1 WG repeat-containing protein [Brevibacillus sp. SYP-B805]
MKGFVRVLLCMAILSGFIPVMISTAAAEESPTLVLESQLYPTEIFPADSFSEGMAIARIEGKYGYIDKSGNVVLLLPYELVHSFREGLAAVYANGKWGYIDKTGKEVIPPQYQWAESFSEGLALVQKNDKYGYVDKTGKEVIPPQYDWGSNFSEGLAIVGIKGKIVCIDKTGRGVFPLEYYLGKERFSEGLLVTRKNGMLVYVDKTGKEAVKLQNQYDYAGNFSEGLAWVEKNKKWGYIDKTGKEVIPLTYSWASDFSEGLAGVETNGLRGFIDKTGRVVISPQYHTVQSFREGLAAVVKNGKGGYIDKKGNEVIPLQYDGTYSFSEGFAYVLVMYGRESGYLANPLRKDNANVSSDGTSIETTGDSAATTTGLKLENNKTRMENKIKLISEIAAKYGYTLGLEEGAASDDTFRTYFVQEKNGSRIMKFIQSVSEFGAESQIILEPIVLPHQDESKFLFIQEVAERLSGTKTPDLAQTLINAFAEPPKRIDAFVEIRENSSVTGLVTYSFEGIRDVDDFDGVQGTADLRISNR